MLNCCRLSLRSCSLLNFSLRAVRVLLGFLLFAFLSLTLFARSLYPCILGSVGMIVTMESASAWARSSQTMPTLFMWYCLVNAAASVALGASSLTSADSDCVTAGNPAACSRVAEVVGLTLAIGSAPMLIFATLTMLLTLCCDREVEACACLRLCQRKKIGPRGYDGSPCTLEPLELMRLMQKHKLGHS